MNGIDTYKPAVSVAEDCHLHIDDSGSHLQAAVTKDIILSDGKPLSVALIEAKAALEASFTLLHTAKGSAFAHQSAAEEADVLAHQASYRAVQAAQAVQEKQKHVTLAKTAAGEAQELLSKALITLQDYQNNVDSAKDALNKATRNQAEARKRLASIIEQRTLCEINVEENSARLKKTANYRQESDRKVVEATERTKATRDFVSLKLMSANLARERANAALAARNQISERTEMLSSKAMHAESVVRKMSKDMTCLQGENAANQ